MKNTTGFQRVQELNGMPVDASSTNRDKNSIYPVENCMHIVYKQRSVYRNEEESMYSALASERAT